MQVEDNGQSLAGHGCDGGDQDGFAHGDELSVLAAAAIQARDTARAVSFLTPRIDAKRGQGASRFTSDYVHIISNLLALMLSCSHETGL